MFSQQGVHPRPRGQVRDLRLKLGYQRPQPRDLRIPPGQQFPQPGIRRTQPSLITGHSKRIGHTPQVPIADRQ